MRAARIAGREIGAGIGPGAAMTGAAVSGGTAAMIAAGHVPGAEAVRAAGFGPGEALGLLEDFHVPGMALVRVAGFVPGAALVRLADIVPGEVIDPAAVPETAAARPAMTGGTAGRRANSSRA